MRISMIANRRNRESIIVILLSFLLLIIALLLRQRMYGIFGGDNYLSVHLIIEFFIVTISFTIAIQSWMIFPHILSSYRLWFGALFFSLGILEIAHTVTFKGMPYFLSESSAYKGTWFFISARLTEAAGMLAIVASKDKKVSSNGRMLAYGISILYSAVWLVIVFSPAHVLPELVREGIGTTPMKNNLEYAGMVLELFVIYFAAVRYQSREVFNLMLIIASIYLIAADYFFTSYKSVTDINNFMGHWFQLAGFYFFQRAIYHTSVEEPFEKQKEVLDKIQYLVFHDDLTKLPNLRFLREKWDEFINGKEAQKKKALLVIDIDRFKNINEALGHSVGDLILQAAADRLQNSLPENMLLGRVSGDQYAVIVREVGDKTAITAAAKRIQASFQTPLQAQHLFLNVNISIGVSLYPEHGVDFDKLLQRANMAFLNAMQENNAFQFFQPGMDVEALEMLVLDNDLYHALPCNELFIVYQPQVNICTGEVSGLEALLRWRHPERGLISPGIFIPIAEKNGLIVPIGEWVLRTACRQVKNCQASGLPPFTVSVNLSTRQFYQQNLTETIIEILNETQLSPKYLELEITESIIMNVENARQILEDLKQLGIRIAIDDFGTGYSSLSYLKDLPIDRLKIDQSFVRDLSEENTSLISMIISLAGHLKMDVIAEGVETAAQKEILRHQGCCKIQGFEFSKPIELDELLKNFNILQEKAKANAMKNRTIIPVNSKQQI